jgi:ribosomal protein S18 acetylase RimI-like enzyme
MISILKPTEKDAALLSTLAAVTFKESHGHSAPVSDISSYIAEKYSTAIFVHELNDPQNLYHIIYYKEKPAGYSNIVFDCPYKKSPVQNIAKLDRIYLLQEFHDLKLGLQLFQFNMVLAQQHGQSGIWLYVWKENIRAINFYTRAGFKIIGSHDFKISATHTNPNHELLLEF